MSQEKTLEQIIREYEAQMPPEIMSMIDSFDWKKELRSIVLQNHLLLDVGTDLEESVYLMILGIIKVNDLYERLVDDHELEEIKVQKIIQEIEAKIFDPLHKKLMTIDTREEGIDPKDPTPSNSISQPEIKEMSEEDPESRDSILAEIEKEPEVSIKTIPTVSLDGTPTPPPSPYNHLTSAAPIPTPPKSFEEDEGFVGVAKPFKFNLNDEADVTTPIEETKKTAFSPYQPQSEDIPPLKAEPIQDPVYGIQEDSMNAGLSGPTIVTTQKINEESPKNKPSGAIDPYREPIE